MKQTVFQKIFNSGKYVDDVFGTLVRMVRMLVLVLAFCFALTLPCYLLGGDLNCEQLNASLTTACWNKQIITDKWGHSFSLMAIPFFFLIMSIGAITPYMCWRYCGNNNMHPKFIVHQFIEIQNSNTKQEAIKNSCENLLVELQLNIRGNHFDLSTVYVFLKVAHCSILISYAAFFVFVNVFTDISQVTLEPTCNLHKCSSFILYFIYIAFMSLAFLTCVLSLVVIVHTIIFISSLSKCNRINKIVQYLNMNPKQKKEEISKLNKFVDQLGNNGFLALYFINVHCSSSITVQVIHELYKQCNRTNVILTVWNKNNILIQKLVLM